MAYSEASKKATQKYVKANYERIYISLPKGNKEAIKAAATDAGESITSYIINATKMRMDAEKG